MFMSYFETRGENSIVASQAAILHDTVEDTQVTIEEIRECFGDTVARYVWFLTKPENYIGDRATRKALDISRLSTAPDVVKAIKLCDLMHNSSSIEEYDPNFWITFKRESKELVEKAGFVDVAFRMSDTETFEKVFRPWFAVINK
jgi:(p)ppGpp synthase/HD superfamily hydrolase